MAFFREHDPARLEKDPGEVDALLARFRVMEKKMLKKLRRKYAARADAAARRRLRAPRVRPLRLERQEFPSVLL